LSSKPPKSHRESLPATLFEKQAQDSSQADGKKNLQAATQPEIALNFLEPVQRKLKTDGEQQHHDSNFSQSINRLKVLNQAKSSGAQMIPVIRKPTTAGIFSRWKIKITIMEAARTVRSSAIRNRFIQLAF